MSPAVQVQTASGSSKAEMTIEGLKEFEAVRDFLYARMRGMRDERHPGARPAAAAAGTPAAAGLDAATAEELAAALMAVAEELRGVRRALAAGGGPPAAGGPPGIG